MRHFIFFLTAALLLSSCTKSEKRVLRKAARIHEKALTVDSHTDTPMWFTRGGFDFGQNNSDQSHRSKLDIPRMKEGKLDGVFMAVFIGQEERTAEGHAEALAEARTIIDSIGAVAERYAGDIALATEPDDLERIAGEGKHAVYLGLENGYPIGNDLSLVDSFYHAGIRYITLCHSYNNDICDSSTDSTEHGGLSPFGEEVVQRMNAL